MAAQTLGQALSIFGISPSVVEVFYIDHEEQVLKARFADHIAKHGLSFETDEEYNNAVEKLAMDQTVYAAYQNGLLKVAATAGVLDSVADRLMIRPPVPSKYVKSAALRKVIEAKDKTKSFAKNQR